MTMKIAINLNVATQLLSLFESLLLAERGGILRDLTLEALLKQCRGLARDEVSPAEVWFNTKMNVPLPFYPVLEGLTILSATEIVEAAKTMCGKN